MASPSPELQAVTGWDIGGAHLKAARIVDGRVIAALQAPAALWRGLDELDRAFEALLGEVTPAGAHVVTMTGELVDLFDSRAAGVEALARAARQRLGDVAIYAGAKGFIAAEAAAGEAEAVASANWHATAALVANRLGEALVVDMGSTTTDIVPVAGGAVRARAFTDAGRMAAGELVYTGATRTPLMAVAERVSVKGMPTTVMAEYFATMADANRLLGRLRPEDDQHPTADGRDKGLAESEARLARLVGRDRDELDAAGWRQLAGQFAEAQIRRVHDHALQVLSAVPLAADAPVVAAGIGRAAIGELARRLERPVVDFATLVDVDPAAGPDGALLAMRAGPAVAVALLRSISL